MDPRTHRTRAAKRERPGRWARAFTLNRSARQFRSRLLNHRADGWRHLK
jgi:hypothetical protein